MATAMTATSPMGHTPATRTATILPTIPTNTPTSPEVTASGACPRRSAGPQC